MLWMINNEHLSVFWLRRLLENCFQSWHSQAAGAVLARLRASAAAVQAQAVQHKAEMEQLRRDNLRFKRIIDEDSSLMRSADLLRTGLASHSKR